MTSVPDAIKQYRVLRRANGESWEIARSDASVSYKAIDHTLDVVVVLTTTDLRESNLDADEASLVRRAKSIMMLRDDRVAALSEFGTIENRFFSVRRWFDGESLSQFIARQNPVDWRESVMLVLDIARALQYALERGVVHGNLSAETVIMLRPQRLDRPDRESKHTIRIVDFALSGSTIIEPGRDVAALGLILQSLLAGRLIEVVEPPAHDGDSSLEAPRPSNIPPVVTELAYAMARQHPTANNSTLPWFVDALERLVGANDSHPALSTTPVIDVRDHQLDATDNPVSAKTPSVVDENLQFTAYRPKTVRPGVWTKMLVFAHLEDRPDWLDKNELDPQQQVEAEARQTLGDRITEYKQSTDDSRVAVPRDGEITLVPEVTGIQFNPPTRSFFWRDGIAVHSESFDMRASAALDGQNARGRLTIFLGRIILAEISLAIRVDGSYSAPASTPSPTRANDLNERSHSRAFRRVFASYSHRDLGIVEEMERHARSFGDEYLRDWVHLRSGERWSDGLRELINASDVFQLFWSPNSARSEFVAQEWQYALTLGRNAFVRPTYWQDPMPDPPEPLKPLHFHRLALTSKNSVPVDPVVLPATQPNAVSVPVIPHRDDDTHLPTVSAPPAMLQEEPEPNVQITARELRPYFLLAFWVLLGTILDHLFNLWRAGR